VVRAVGTILNVIAFFPLADGGATDVVTPGLFPLGKGRGADFRADLRGRAGHGMDFHDDVSCICCGDGDKPFSVRESPNVCGDDNKISIAGTTASYAGEYDHMKRNNYDNRTTITL
jgi:hypothetical protein